MIKSVTLRPFPLPIEFHGKPQFVEPSKSCFAVVRCSSTRDVPKLELFSRGKFDRVLQDPPLIEKTENELSGTYILPTKKTFPVLFLHVLHRKMSLRIYEISTF